MELDNWQKEVIEYDGNIALRSGRQVGKSTAVGEKAARFAQEHDNSNVMIIAPAQRQSWHLFEKVREHTDKRHRETILAAGGYKQDPTISERRNMELERMYDIKHGIYKERPSKSELSLKNGSHVYSLPVGKSGTFIRCYSLDLLIADEAAFIPESVWVAVKPMLAVSRKMTGHGWEVLLSTPFGKGGYFYDACSDTDYKQFHISSEKCGRIPKDFLMKEKKKLTAIEYAQEYLGEFVDEFNQFFPTTLIKSRMTFYSWNFSTEYKRELKYFLGVDLARYGEDENAFVIAEMQQNKSLKIISAETSERINLARTFNRIIMLDDKYDFNRIFIDDAGLGAGVTDLLIEKLGRKVVGLSNAKKTIDNEGRTGKIFKEDLYSHAVVMMETDGKIEIINSLKLLRSLKSMTFQYTAEKNIKIFGKYSHLAEAFVRACWAEKAKSLKLFVM